jgi:uncharacterized protein (AIM24 family)
MTERHEHAVDTGRPAVFVRKALSRKTGGSPRPGSSWPNACGSLRRSLPTTGWAIATASTRGPHDGRPYLRLWLPAVARGAAGERDLLRGRVSRSGVPIPFRRGRVVWPFGAGAGGWVPFFPMAEMGAPLDRFAEVETGEAFTVQNPRLLKVELSATGVLAKNGSMVAYQGEVRFEHRGGGLSRFIKKAATGESLRLMQASGSGELFLAYQAMLVHVLRLNDESLTVNGFNILAFEDGIDWDITRIKGGAAGVLAGGLFNVHLNGTGYVALLSDGEPVRLNVSEAPTFADPQAAIAWSGGVNTSLKADVQAKSLIGLGSGESFQLGFAGSGWVLVQPSEGRRGVQA